MTPSELVKAGPPMKDFENRLFPVSSEITVVM